MRLNIYLDFLIKKEQPETYTTAISLWGLDRSSQLSSKIIQDVLSTLEKYQCE